MDQRIAGEVDVVLRAFADPSFLAALAELPDLADVEVLSHDVEGDVVRQRVRYRFVKALSPVVERVVDPKRLSWVDETEYELSARRGSFRLVPDHYRHRLRCHGTYRFTAAGADTMRTIEGELMVSYPLVGRAVERAIVSGLESRLGDEARLVERWLAGRP